MLTIDALRTFFGWCSAINIGLYLLIVVCVIAMRSFAYKLNARLFSVDEEFVKHEMFRFIANYKLVMTVFCFVPYIALLFMS